MISSGFPGGTQADITRSGGAGANISGPYISDHKHQIADLQTVQTRYQTGKLTSYNWSNHMPRSLVAI